MLTQDTYGKEVSKNFEIGLKSRLFDGRLALNVALFHADIENSQQYRFDVGASIGVIDNIDEARIRGAEIDLNASLTDTLSFFAAGGFIDSEITKFVANPAIEGNRTPYAPQYNLTAGLQLTQPVSADVEFVGRLEYNRIGRTWFDLENTPNTDRSPVNLVNARIGFTADRYEIALWGRNLTDKKYATEAVVLFPYLNVLSLGMTRSYGIEGRMKF